MAAAYAQKDGRTTVPLDFEPCGSWLILFREHATAHPSSTITNGASFGPRSELQGAWTVAFDPRWGGPANVAFDKLVSWTTRAEHGIKFYSGTAIC